MISYLLPTRDRPQRLRATLDAIGALDAAAHEAAGGAEVIVIDNGSSPPVEAPRALRNGFPLHVIRMPDNPGAAARNAGARHARGRWLVMLDDDSFPLDAAHVQVLMDADPDVAAVGAQITLPDGSREAGGLPEVFIGCGAAIRREQFIRAGGYDWAFDYYAEEYDLCARLLLDGWRIAHDFRFRVRHEKVAAGRDMDRIVHRLVRNNCWVAQRYAPQHVQQWHVHETIARYGRIAVKEHAARGFVQGMAEVTQTMPLQRRRPMPDDLWDRFTGLAYARAALKKRDGSYLFGVKKRDGSDFPRAVAIVGPEHGKNAWAVRQALQESGIRIVQNAREAEALVIGTLSPGPMMDAWERLRPGDKPVMIPWPQAPCRPPRHGAAVATADHKAIQPLNTAGHAATIR